TLVCGNSIFNALTQNSDFQVDVIIPKLIHIIKADISIDKADISPYRTILMQAQQPKRVTIGKNIWKKSKNNGCLMLLRY
ncbi:MAG: hypothetical protein MUO43_15130, partial [Desulfobacterales bacterium]|nr:hypothetical protein [Desulfobacterales bacterium]